MLLYISPWKSPLDCMTVPIFFLRLDGSRPLISLPSKYIAPVSGFSNPRSSLIRVDLPQPVFPTIATYSPGFTLREISFRIYGASSS